MTTQTEITHKNHHRAVRFFWCFLICASVVSLGGNVAHAVLPFIPHVLVQIGAAAVPPVALLAAVHGIALAVRAGASGKVYGLAIAAVAVIGVGAFGVSFLTLRDLMQVIGYNSTIAWIFPAIIDTAVAVSTMMLVALGNKPARRMRRAATQTPTAQSAKTEARPSKPVAKVQAGQPRRGQVRLPVQLGPVQSVQDSVQTNATQADVDLASELIALNVTTQPVDTVIAVLAARRDGASINASATASGINFRTAQRIVEAAEARREGDFASTG